MKRVALGIISAVLSVHAEAAGGAAKTPNIITYMVDDLGWNHISAARATRGTHKKFYHTPNIEKLAKVGVTFTHAYPLEMVSGKPVAPPVLQPWASDKR